MRLRRRLRNVHIINHTSPPWGEEILNKKGRSGNSRAGFPTEITRTESHGEKLATNFTNYTKQAARAAELLHHAQ